MADLHMYFLRYRAKLSRTKIHFSTYTVRRTYRNQYESIREMIIDVEDSTASSLKELNEQNP